MTARRRTTLIPSLSLVVLGLGLVVGCGDDSSRGDTESTATATGSASASTSAGTEGSGVTSGETASGSGGASASTTSPTTTSEPSTGTSVGTSDATSTAGTTDVTSDAGTSDVTSTTGTTTDGTTGGVTATSTGTTSGGTTGESGCDPGSDGCVCLPGDQCDGELICVGDLCEPMPMSSCGDGILDPGEACDDGDDDDADGCTKLCTTTELIGLSTSINNTCVILSGGTVRCWGSGDLAQLGVPGLTEPIGDDELPSSIPPIQLGGAAVQLASGANHNCARLDNGDLRCWGFSNYGQLGLGNMLSIGDNEHPASVGPVMIGGPIQSVAATTNHSCAALVNGDVRCWGYYTDGNLGYGKFGNIGDNEVPSTQAAVKLGEPATAVAVGEVHSCALLASKTVRCWGTNLSGQLGLGMPAVIGDNDHPIDYPKIIFTDVEAIAASRHHTCVLQTGGVVRCFGDNNYGQLGYGHTNRIGDNESPDVGPVILGGKAIKIDCGINVTCALLEGGDVRCWGRNNYGQLGLANKNNVGDNELPIDVPVINLGGKALDIDSSGYHTCAVVEGGGLRCWGYPTNSALGYGEIVILGDDEHPADLGFVEIF